MGELEVLKSPKKNRDVMRVNHCLGFYHFKWTQEHEKII